MNDSQTLSENFCFDVRNVGNENDFKKFELKKSLKVKFDKEKVANKSISKKSWSKIANCDKNWYDAFSFNKSNVYAKEAWKCGSKKIWETLGNVRSTFGSFSQKIKSTKRRQQLINLDSPNTTPNERSRAVLGRTPTKLYTPFNFDTPKKNEIFSHKKILISSCKKNLKFDRRKYQEAQTRSRQLSQNSLILSKTAMSNESLQTQIGIYEFQSIANKIVKINQDN